MNPIRIALSGVALAAALGYAQPALAADDAKTATGVATCTASDPGVMLNTTTKEYVVMSSSPTAAGSFSANGNPPPAYLVMMCRSQAQAQGGKPAFGGMQTSMGAMLMNLNSLDVTPDQRRQIATVMHDASTQNMRSIDAILTPAQRARMDAAMRQMAFPGP